MWASWPGAKVCIAGKKITKLCKNTHIGAGPVCSSISFRLAGRHHGPEAQQPSVARALVRAKARRTSAHARAPPRRTRGVSVRSPSSFSREAAQPFNTASLLAPALRPRALSKASSPDSARWAPAAVFVVSPGACAAYQEGPPPASSRMPEAYHGGESSLAARMSQLTRRPSGLAARSVAGPDCPTLEARRTQAPLRTAPSLSQAAV